MAVMDNGFGSGIFWQSDKRACNKIISNGLSKIKLAPKVDPKVSTKQEWSLILNRKSMLI